MNIELVSGDSLEIDVDFRFAADEPLDLTGYTAVYAAKSRDGGNVVQVNLVISDAPNGVVKVAVPAGRLVGEGLWNHQVRITGPGRTHTEPLGELAILPSLIS